jgi:hypothetical protein
MTSAREPTTAARARNRLNITLPFTLLEPSSRCLREVPAESLLATTPLRR